MPYLYRMATEWHPIFGIQTISQTLKKPLAILLCATSLAASAQKIGASKVSAEVQAGFRKNFPAVKDVKWEAEKGDYEASFRDGGVKMSALFSPTGQWKETEKAIPETALPAHAYIIKKSRRDLHKSSKNARIRILCRISHKGLLHQPRRRCGYDKHIERCHIKPISSFPPTATLTEVNALSNIVQLCPNCHWELDNGFLDLCTIQGSNL